LAPNAQETRAIFVPLIAALGCIAALFLGGALSRTNLDWYETLIKPDFTPPNIVFIFVWPVLYAMLAMSAIHIGCSPGRDGDRKLAFIWFFIQLVLGVLWAFVFFWLRSPGLGFVVMLAFLAAIVITIVLFDRLSRAAALLLVPYALWVCYATGLNVTFWLLNG
jgi:tryptophan-rich sensory protein